MDIGKLMGPGLQFAGDLFGAYEAQEMSEDNRTLQRETQARNEALQREFAQHGVRWRVEDAKAAGLHPVFALTGGGAAYSPTSVIGDAPEARYGKALSNMGQNLTRAQMAQETEIQREERRLRLQLLQSQIDETDARTFALYSQDARDGVSRGLPAFPDPEYPGATLNPHWDHHRNRVEVVPAKQVSSSLDDPSTAASIIPGHGRYKITPWSTMDLPFSEEGLSEMFENLGVWGALAYLKRNASMKGTSSAGLFKRLWREFLYNQPMPGADPEVYEYESYGKKRYELPWWTHSPHLEGSFPRR